MARHQPPPSLLYIFFSVLRMRLRLFCVFVQPSPIGLYHQPSPPASPCHTLKCTCDWIPSYPGKLNSLPLIWLGDQILPRDGCLTNTVNVVPFSRRSLKPVLSSLSHTEHRALRDGRTRMEEPGLLDERIEESYQRHGAITSCCCLDNAVT